jgi:hypothetical protein
MRQPREQKEGLASILSLSRRGEKVVQTFGSEHVMCEKEEVIRVRLRYSRMSRRADHAESRARGLRAQRRGSIVVVQISCARLWEYTVEP